MNIGDRARNFIQLRKEEIDRYRKLKSIQIRPKAHAIALEISNEIEPFILEQARQGNEYLLFRNWLSYQLKHSINDRLTTELVMEELASILGCQVKSDNDNWHISWKELHETPHP